MDTEFKDANMDITLGQLLDFVEENKQDKVFKEYTKAQIAAMLMEGIEDKCLYYATTSTGKLTGMILAKISIGSKVVWIEENLAMSLANLRAFALKAKKEFPNYEFLGFKCGKDRQYTKLFNRLTK